jgi:hypothetical protein
MGDIASMWNKKKLQGVYTQSFNIINSDTHTQTPRNPANLGTACTGSSELASENGYVISLQSHNMPCHVRLT